MTKEVSVPEGRLRANVIWYNQVKGYGFLAVEGYPYDLFIHSGEVRNAGLPVTAMAKGAPLTCVIGHDKNERVCATELLQD